MNKDLSREKYVFVTNKLNVLEELAAETETLASMYRILD